MPIKMNWQEINNKYPKAFALLETLFITRHWFWDEDKNEWYDDYGDEPYILRHLYDFFDEQEILCGVEIKSYYPRTYFGWVDEQASPTFYTVDSAHRTEAEEQAFIKAFEILELRLNE